MTMTDHCLDIINSFELNITSNSMLNDRFSSIPWWLVLAGNSNEFSKLFCPLGTIIIDVAIATFVPKGR